MTETHDRVAAADRSESHRVGSLEVQLAPGATRELPVDLRAFERRFGSISGQLTGAAERIELSVQLLAAGDPEETLSTRELRPDAEGRFTFTGLPPGSYVVLARARDSQEPAVRVPVRLGEGESLSVEVSLAR